MLWLKRIAISIAALLFIFTVTVYLLLRGSLPTLSGELAFTVLAAPTTIERDALGVATITAASRADAAFALGLAHGQDRFFQMDLQRRAAAGELSALLGAALIDTDKRFRRHNFRAVAKQVIAAATLEQRVLIEAYVAGVNAALGAMSVRPFEYLLLNSQPAPWTADDCVLVAYAMYIDLNDSQGVRELERGRLHATLPPPLFDALYPRGTEWDAPIDGVNLATLAPPLPDAAIVDLRTRTSLARPTQRSAEPENESETGGSNNWALAGARTASGAALIANDMHLRLRVPHIWYRARMLVKSKDAAHARDLSGVTLPGLPLLVAGSNGHIAWGFTNTHGDFGDLVVLEVNSEHPNRYRNGDRFEEFSVRPERIEVRGAPAIEIEYRDTMWGPVLDETLEGKPLAFAWTAQRAEATNLNQLGLESARSVAEALDIANSAGIPVQNLVVGDAQGHIAWTPIGKLPKRVGFDGRLPTCWGCAPNVGWNGFVAPGDYPRVIDPANGQIWSANSRTFGGTLVGSEAAPLGPDWLGDEDMDRGARTRQIRDALLTLTKATATDMLKVQLDDRALFLARWRDLLMRMQDEAYLRGHATRRAALKIVEEWSGHAAVSDAGYRIVRAFRTALQEDVYNDLIAAARVKYPEARFRPSARFEHTLWQIVTTQPPHLLNANFERWDLRILASFDRALAQLKEECGVRDRNLDECTWGERNTLRMEHALAGALPFGRLFLGMAAVQLPGDNDMPRVQGPTFGASERFAVSPGKEAEGVFQMPGGQSGHPLSPFFRAGHEAWVNGEPTPFLPGAARHILRLAPLASQ